MTAEHPQSSGGNVRELATIGGGSGFSRCRVRMSAGSTKALSLTPVRYERHIERRANNGYGTPMREPPRYDFRLEDLRAWHLVEASCRRCRHKATIAHELLMRGRPSFTRLFDLERALLCRRC